MNIRRILRIIVIILILAGIGIGGYYLWKFISARGGLAGLLPTGEAPTTAITEIIGGTGEIGPTTTGTETLTQPPQVVTPQLSILINSPVSQYWLNSSQNSIYFANLDGQIFKINSDASRQLVNSQILNSLRSITPSNDGSLAIAEFNYPQLPTFSIFSASTTNWQPLPVETISAAISPNSNRIAYTDRAALKILDLATQKTTEIQKMSQIGLNLTWLSEPEILLSSDPSIEHLGYLYSFNMPNKTLRTLINGEYGLTINWAKDGFTGIKISSNGDKNAKLSLIDNFGSSVINFTFLSIPEKCLINSQRLYCGIPQNIRLGMKMPDDYYQKNDYFVDDIFSLDLQTAKFTKIFDGQAGIALDIKNLKLQNNNLLFINRYDNKVYSLTLNE